MSKNNQASFVKYPLCLSYLFSPTEARFIIHMLDTEFLKANGYNTDWSRAEYMKRMQLTEYSFDNAVKRLIGIGLLTRKNNLLGNKVYYSFNMELYDKLVSILSVTYNVDKLINFCKSVFIQGNRTIQSVTDEEVIQLADDPGNGIKKKHRSVS